MQAPRPTTGGLHRHAGRVVPLTPRALLLRLHVLVAEAHGLEPIHRVAQGLHRVGGDPVAVVVQIKPIPILSPSGTAEEAQNLPPPHVKNFAVDLEKGSLLFLRRLLCYAL